MYKNKKIENFTKKILQELSENKEVLFYIKVRAGSARDEFVEILDNEVAKINISAPPEKGKANKALIYFLANHFSINKNQIEIKAGKTDKTKLIKIIW